MTPVSLTDTSEPLSTMKRGLLGVLLRFEGLPPPYLR